ncbi:hypothetical protein CHS0354_021020 [Potamilus streckersoni]|uniref:Neurotransmitter-gated ion-channel transmembrane domain-containing protein n=1 Tax=Potamilus streckersoni TaxID=2493646 RepID=A0AAE0SRJ0_9BIVA|nr:hypothetical protein CHS0354_021020 [Potamilus streckersoni]
MIQLSITGIASIDNLKFVWHKDSVTFDPSMKLPQFEILSHKTNICDATYYGVDYSCIRLDIVLERNFGSQKTQIYIPCILIIILSWVSFWIDIDAVPARISLGPLTVLTMITHSAGTRSNLPVDSYIRAIDIWMAICLFFVLAAMLESAFVNVLSRIEKRRVRETIKNVSKPKQLQSTLDDEETQLSEVGMITCSI